MAASEPISTKFVRIRTHGRTLYFNILITRIVTTLFDWHRLLVFISFSPIRRGLKNIPFDKDLEIVELLLGNPQSRGRESGAYDHRAAEPGERTDTAAGLEVTTK